jgi:arginase family enzyme
MENKYIGDIIHESFYDPLVIIGFPYDQGAINVQKSKGAYLGPDAFRRFLSYQDFGVLKNVEEGIDIEKFLPKISDYGNIQTQEVTNGQKTPISD